MNVRYGVAIAIAAVVLPLSLYAQEDALHTQIRADLRQDPRTAQMSSAEFDALVNALADQAQKDGTADQYLEAHSTFDYSKLFPLPQKPSMIAVALASPLTLALGALLLVLLAVALYIIRRRGTPTETSSDMETME